MTLVVEANLQAVSMISPSLSVIIPVLNEAEHLETVLHRVQQATSVEIIIVDGGSQDSTLTLAQSFSAVKVISTLPCRAQQMNAGAQAASGKILLFLHGDTLLPEDYLEQVQIVLKSRAIAGAFELKISGSMRGLRLVEQLVSWRSHYFQFPYGDQALFLTAAVFHELGGFAELPIMEDFEFVSRLRKRGKIAIAATAVITSGRRWQKLGVFRTTLINQLMIIAYRLGVSPSRLARWYRQAKPDSMSFVSNRQWQS